LLSGLPVAAVYTSPLRRAAATAAPIGERHRLPPRRLDDLRELDFGRLEGLTFDRIEREWPRVHRAWMCSPTGVRFPGGERYADLERRARAAGREIRAGHPEATVVVVTHGGVVRAMLAEALVMPRRAVFAIEQRHGALNVLDWYGQTAVVRLV